MATVFISYRKKDLDLCRDLAGRLKAAGHEVWWDYKLKPGQNFVTEIEQKLRTSDAVIVLWTKNSVRSKWVYFETFMASLMGKLLPLVVGRCDIPVGLRDLHSHPYNPKLPTDQAEWQHILRQLDEVVADGAATKPQVASLDELIWSKIQHSRNPQDFVDFIERSPKSRHRAEAEALRATHQRRRNVENSLWWILGLVMYGALLAPLVMLHAEYPVEDARLLMGLYFHFFGFFPIFGALIVPIYCFGYARALRYAWGLGFGFRPGSIPSRMICLLLLVGMPAATCAAITYIEVSDGYAPWQLRPAILSTPVNQLVSDTPIEAIAGEPDIRQDNRTLREIFSQTRDLHLRSAFDISRRAPLSGRCMAAPPASSAARNMGTDRGILATQCLTHMNNLQRVMERRLQEFGERSRTGTIYKWGFFFFAWAFMGTYFNIFFLTVRSETVRLWMTRISPWSGQRFSQLLYLFALQLVLIAIWFVARILFQLETETILPGSGGIQFTQTLRNSYFFFFAVYLAAIGFVVAAALRLNNLRTRLGIILIALVTTTFLGLAFSVSRFLQALQSFFGVHANEASMIVLSILTFFIFFLPLVLPNLLAEREEDLADLTHGPRPPPDGFVGDARA